jgi:hypothetical protein
VQSNNARNSVNTCNISDCHGSNRKAHNLLECEVIWSTYNVTLFQRNLLAPSSEQKSKPRMAKSGTDIRKGKTRTSTG